MHTLPSHSTKAESRITDCSSTNNISCIITDCSSVSDTSWTEHTVLSSVFCNGSPICHLIRIYDDSRRAELIMFYSCQNGQQYLISNISKESIITVKCSTRIKRVSLNSCHFVMLHSFLCSTTTFIPAPPLHNHGIVSGHFTHLS